MARRGADGAVKGLLAMMTLRWVACAAGLLAGTPACRNEPGSPDNRQLVSEAPSCIPGTPRSCPCAGAGEGTQLCSESGDAYGPCNGCFPAVALSASPSPTPAPPMATAPPPPQRPQTAKDGGAPEADAAGGTTFDASLPDAGRVDAATEDIAPRGELPVMTGTYCGVGLAVICALATEKCCIRSLATDSCIDVDAHCTGDVDGGTTLEAHCDGPEDCNDDRICCGTLKGSGYTEFSCQSSCDYNGTQRIACHSVDADCPGGTICAHSQLLTNFQTCIDPATIEQ